MDIKGWNVWVPQKKKRKAPWALRFMKILVQTNQMKFGKEN
jgi:hypothetical protein